jgi:GxxExxY protein
MSVIVYEQECSKIYGLLFKIQNELGTSFQEKHYQRAFENILIKNNIPYKREISLEVKCEGKLLGKFFADFIIYDKILLEFKCTPNITQDHIKQVLRYLQSLNLKLGLIVNFRNYPLKPIRVLNSHYSQPQGHS